MPLIDGKYEILRQRTLSDSQTLVQATDPEGTPVRIVWYDVGPDGEAAFERYRRALRRLGRRDDVLLRDVVARPGAHYTVWDDPGEAPRVEADGTWRRRLEALGLDPDGCDLRRNGRRTVLAGLAWDGSPLPSPSPTPTPAAASAAGHGDARPRSLPRLPLPLPPPWLRTWTVGLLATLMAVALGLGAWERADNDRVVSIPDVSGMPAQKAADTLTRLGLTVAPRATPDGGPVGTALSTEPPAGTSLRPGRSVTLRHVRPSGTEQLETVPDLRSRSLAEDLRSELANGPWRMGHVSRVPANLPADTVMAQRPEPGRRPLGEGRIDLLVSAGPRSETTFLPDLRGMREEDARALARIAGFPAERILVDEVPGADVPAGRVISMTPAPWTTLTAAGATLRLIVAGAEGGVAPASAADADDGGVPDLTGLRRRVAEREAAARDLDVRVERIQRSDLPEGVILQDPAPGEPPADTVSLTVNTRPVPVPVPVPSVEVRTPGLRWVPYRFAIEPGIPERTAEVVAVTVDGERTTVTQRTTQGGEVLEGRWLTATPGPVTFRLSLGGAFYTETRVTQGEPVDPTP